MQLHNGTIGLFTISAFYKSIENMFHEASNIRLKWVNDPDQLMGSIARYPNNLYSNREDGYQRLDRFLRATGLDQWYQTPAFKKITPPFFSDYTITAAYNSPDPSSTWGFELEHQMNFGFLPVKWMQNIVLSYNVTIMRSKTQVWVQNTVFDTTWTPAQYNDRGRKITDSAFTPVGNYEAVLVNRAMEDQPELFGNLSLGYDIAGFSARISVFYQSRYTRSYSTSGQSDAIQNEFIKWDLSLKQQITSQIALILNINNILNREESQSRYNRYYSWGDLSVYAQHYGRTMDLGIRINL